MKINIRNSKEEDFSEIYEFVKKCPPLETYGEHFYKIILRYFGDTSIVAVDSEGKIVGFSFGFVSQKDPETFFIWQIGIREGMRGTGTGSKLIEGIINSAKEKRCKRIELTVDTTNTASQKFFGKMGFLNISKKESRECIDLKGTLCVGDYYGKGRHFTLFGKYI